MELKEYPDRDIMMVDLAGRIASELRGALSLGERATLAVPGGTTPGPVFDALAEVSLDWARVDVVPTDERWVPADDPRSNTRLIRERLLTGQAAAARLVPLYDPAAAAPEDALERLCEGVAEVLPLTVCLLGMGADGHIASLFRGGEGLDAALADDAPALAAIRAAEVPEPRVTLTAPVLMGAMHLHLLITGPEKRAALERAAERGPVADAPVRLILGEAIVHHAE
ncbi:6-phosphogluconolactonase [Maritimibacter sp. 55A14]|uniref:6-phosphogluconolactonase n=1 Tax=Maritimibacter sp. 55A14 TaxID=2174844 RepID=UPI000D619DDB|nr:6-phosphogluconolactonase [Maritimibacter sp. 55A14]PWE34216.1 6-phosphogluconolactonase [Maritimibacter sp. 55A14]